MCCIIWDLIQDLIGSKLSMWAKMLEFVCVVFGSYADSHGFCYDWLTVTHPFGHHSIYCEYLIGFDTSGIACRCLLTLHT